MHLFKENKDYIPTDSKILQLGTEVKDLLYVNTLIAELKQLPQSKLVTDLIDRAYDTYHKRSDSWIKATVHIQLEQKTQSLIDEVNSQKTSIELLTEKLKQSESFLESMSENYYTLLDKYNVLRDHSITVLGESQTEKVLSEVSSQDSDTRIRSGKSILSYFKDR
jgi:ATP adenylyltransferase/5',5'''-P-1,P-4-tetraphosphate phosphorylase II